MEYTGRKIAFGIVITNVLAWGIPVSIFWGFHILWVVIAFIVASFYGIAGWYLGKQYDKAKFYSDKDDLTGVYNRRYAVNSYQKLQTKIANQKQTLCVLLVDADNLKIINDTFGHQVGDTAIKNVAKVLIRNSRKYDIVARIGGDEFLVIAPFTDKESAHKIVERIEQELMNVSQRLGVTISASVGTATYPSDGKSLNALMKVADRNMYMEKQNKPQLRVRTM